TLRAVLGADGSLDPEDYRSIAAVIAALGLPEADAHALRWEAPIAPESFDDPGEVDHAVARAIVRGAWLAAAGDAIDPREEHAIRVVGAKMGVTPDDIEEARRSAVEFIDWRRRAGVAAVDGVRYVLSDRVPGLGVQLAALTATIMLPRRWREEALAPVAQGAPVALAKRHVGLEADDRRAVLGVAWAASLVDDPSVGRRALLRARWERFAEDLGHRPGGRHGHLRRSAREGRRPPDRARALRGRGPRRHPRRRSPRRGDGPERQRARVRDADHRGPSRRWRQGRPPPGHRAAPGGADRVRFGAAPPRDRRAPGPPEGHGDEPRWNGHRRASHARERRPPEDAHRRRGGGLQAGR